ncbi:MAG: phosphoribosylformylglycinamidine cyclo-ligase [Methanophagales archaeon]|nr:phosphoribosylformylglycinamidine cyclo-ligase [Methanophagales archaeon]
MLMQWTYAKAGVDIKREAGVVKALTGAITRQPDLRSVFSGLFELPFDTDHLIAISTDGVGSKVLIAAKLDIWSTLGIDCVAMNVNDIYCLGARPLAFTDYLAMEKPDERIAAEIGKGLEAGAEIADISIVSGETAILPEVVNGLDLAGTCVGYVRKDKVIRGEQIEVGDLVLGIKSAGIHSNGLTLARKVIEEEGEGEGEGTGLSYTEPFAVNPVRSIGEELLRPTRIYTEVLELLARCEVHGLAHITGSGLLKLNQITDLGFDIYNPFEPDEIFTFLQEKGNITDEEMYTTFNMGMGFAIVIPESEEQEAIRITRGKIVGEVVERGAGIKVGGGVDIYV